MSVELIKAMQDPTLYNHPTEDFQVLETHISWIILTGSYAYKIKKPVNFGFLNFSSLDKREFYCNEELRLNRRLAPDLYIEVITISGSPSHPILSVADADHLSDLAKVNGANPPIEYALKMVQFDQSGLLDVLQEAKKLTTNHIETLAQRLARFHKEVDTDIPDDHFGTAPAVSAPVYENFEQIQAKLTQPQQLAELPPLKDWAISTFQSLEALIKQRRELGFIRECHGDLHLGNITLFKNHIVIFDCIEFNASLSWIDVINDLAFLVMDLEKRKQFSYANQLTNRYLEITGDYQGAVLLRFYKAYRSMVRAKVSILSLHVGTDESSIHANHQLMNDYRKYIDLADSYTSPVSHYILLMHGFSGSGKSHASGRLVEQLGAVRIRTDVERKRLFNYEADDNTDSSIDGGIYTHEATQQTYSHVASQASMLLEGRVPVIIDAANLKQWQRDLFVDVATSQSVPIIIISCCADSDVLRERVIKRAEQPNPNQPRDASEAKVDTLEQQLTFADALSTKELSYCIQLRTDQTDALSSTITEIQKRVASFNY